ncbi:FGGY family carbohydrate kinase [uncultured Brachyspira sp.]|uniref:FGGY family carbohydrate kinase n=1 Tax=uncultured Brachyspira sp. TaxID=221953 RepID=UPI00261B5991|nr:FGGY family carbohydrate kinase [uncultured Brachyspira sp.]
MYTLGIDLSTQSLTLSIINYKTYKNDLNISVAFNSLEEIKNSPMNKNTLLIDSKINGKAEQDINIFLAALDKAFFKLKSECDIKSIKAIQISAQQHGHVYLSDNYKHNIEKLKNKSYVNQNLIEILEGSYSYNAAPIWRTSCTQKEANELREAAGGKEKMIQITASNSPLRFTGAVIKYNFDSNEGLSNNTYKIFLLNTFIASILTAKDDISVDFGNASGMSLMDYSKREWNDTLLNTVSPDLKQKLGNIDSPSSFAGYITTYFTEKYGFDSECIVGIGSGDNPETKVLYKGDILSLGTSFVYMLNINENSRDFSGVSNAMYDGVGNPFMIFCRTNGAIVWDEVMKMHDRNYREITLSLEQNIDNLPIMLWQKENESVPISRAFDIKRYYEKHSFDNDYKGIVLSSLGLVAAYSKKFSSDSTNNNDLSVTGGPTKDKEILKIVANIWQCPIKLLPSGGASLGAAIAAMLLLKEKISLDDVRNSLIDNTVIEPDSKLSKKYEDYQKAMLEKFEEITKVQKV